MKHSLIAIYDDVLLRPLEIEDIEKLREWRNDTENNRFLRNVGFITKERQLNWFNDYLEDEEEIIFAIEEIHDLRRMVGSVALYGFEEDSAEVGKILIGDREANGRGIGRKAMVMAMQVGFQKFDFKRYTASVHQENIRAHINDLKIGFQIIGKHVFEGGGYEDELELSEERFREVNSYVGEIMIME